MKGDTIKVVKEKWECDGCHEKTAIDKKISQLFSNPTPCTNSGCDGMWRMYGEFVSERKARA